MKLASPQSAILSAVIFNALIIIALIPLALRGVTYRPVGAAALLRRNLLIYGLGGIVVAVHRHQIHRSRRLGFASGLRSPSCCLNLRPAIVMIVLFTALTGLVYPWRSPASLNSCFHDKANGSVDRTRWQDCRLYSDRSELHVGALFSWPPLGDQHARLRRIPLRRSTRPITPRIHPVPIWARRRKSWSIA